MVWNYTPPPMDGTPVILLAEIHGVDSNGRQCCRHWCGGVVFEAERNTWVESNGDPLVLDWPAHLEIHGWIPEPIHFVAPDGNQD